MGKKFQKIFFWLKLIFGQKNGFGPIKKKSNFFFLKIFPVARLKMKCYPPNGSKFLVRNVTHQTVLLVEVNNNMTMADAVAIQKMPKNARTFLQS